MNQWTFTIKVSDILLHSWTRDSIHFTSIFSEKIPWLQETWITWTLVLKNLNKSEMLLTTDEITADILTTCDRCWKEFIEKRILDDISIQAKVLTSPLLSEDILVIDPKDLTVDVEDFLVDQFLLHQPLKNLCISCEQTWVNEDDEDEEIETKLIRH
jgi:uncharacterized metal-binding protein YceD (DUF177 family)